MKLLASVAYLAIGLFYLLLFVINLIEQQKGHGAQKIEEHWAKPATKIEDSKWNIDSRPIRQMKFRVQNGMDTKKKQTE